jgi:hypothetical protein
MENEALPSEQPAAEQPAQEWPSLREACDSFYRQAAASMERLHSDTYYVEEPVVYYVQEPVVCYNPFRSPFAQIVLALRPVLVHRLVQYRKTAGSGSDKEFKRTKKAQAPMDDYGSFDQQPTNQRYADNMLVSGVMLAGDLKALKKGSKNATERAEEPNEFSDPV